MIIVRDVFHLEFGKARDAIEHLKKGRSALEAGGYPVQRLLADVTGEYYTLVMESRFENLAAFENAIGESTAQDEWRQHYKELVPLVRHGRREVLREVA